MRLDKLKFCFWCTKYSQR